MTDSNSGEFKVSSIVNSAAQIVADELGSTTKSWDVARESILALKPIPWFIWRIGNQVFSQDNRVGELPEGMLYGLRNILNSCLKDPSLSALLPKSARPEKISVRELLQVLPTDTLAAFIIMHAIARKIIGIPQLQRLQGLSNDCLNAARLGEQLGVLLPLQGTGRAMLLSFIRKCSPLLPLSGSTETEVVGVRTQLSTGVPLEQAIENVTGVSPLRICALLCASAGLSVSAVSNVARIASGMPASLPEWHALLEVPNRLLLGEDGEVTALMAAVGIERPELQVVQLRNELKTITRNGHKMDWLFEGNETP